MLSIEIIILYVLIVYLYRELYVQRKILSDNGLCADKSGRKTSSPTPDARPRITRTPLGNSVHAQVVNLSADSEEPTYKALPPKGSTFTQVDEAVFES